MKMTSGDIKKEFGRWVDAGRPDVFFKVEDSGSWGIVNRPLWQYGVIYVVDDEQAELRKLQVDKPETKFEYRVSNGSWAQAIDPAWGLDIEYRVKPREWWGYASVENKILCWVWNDSSKIKVARQVIRRRLSGVYVSYGAQEWEYAEPIKPEDCWADPTTYASTS